MIVLAIASSMAFFALAAAASAATYFVEQGATGLAPCVQADPCGTIGEGIDAHRLAPDPADLIAVGPGSYPENVDATDPADDGLTIRGSLTAGGDPATVVSGEGASGPPGCFAPCIVALGATPDTEVAMENVEVVQDSTDLDSNLTPIFLDGGSDLETVDVQIRDLNTFAAVELCTDPGTVFEDVNLDATGAPTAAGISGCAGVTIVDSTVLTDDAPALDVGGSPTGASDITRSRLGAAVDSTQPVLAITSGLTIDSSLLTGGSDGIDFQGAAGALIDVNNSTIDARDPGVNDTGSGARSLFIARDGTDPIDVLTDSSLLVEQLSVDIGSTPTTLTCWYSNFTDLATPLDPDFDDDCPTLGDPGSTNTATNPAQLFEDAATGDWSLQAGSPAIDAGQPGGIPPGFSTTDLAGDPRRLPGTAATCPTGVRDQGAYEAPASACEWTLTVSTTGPGTGTVTGPGIDCGGAGHADCTESVPSGTAIELTATPAQGSQFDGFSGGGCSTSPCTVTVDANESVSAAFSESSPPPIAERTITLQADKRRVKRGSEVTLSGQITSSAAGCMANQIIELQRKHRRDSRFVARTTVGTGASGRFTYSFRMSKPPRKFRVVAPQSAKCSAAESAAVEIRKRKR